MDARTSPVQKRMPELDGLRGAAILGVVFCHYSYLLIPYVKLRSVRLVIEFLPWRVWIDMFFVLSGFLIGDILLRSRDAPNFFSSFYTRRVFRIFPVFYAIAAVVSLCYWLDARFFHFGASIPSRLAAASCLLYFSNSIGPSIIQWPALDITWSLGVEEQFYLTIPFAIRYLRRKQVLLGLVALSVSATVFRIGLFFAQPGSFFWNSYALAPARTDDLSLGVLLALIRNSATADSWVRSHLKEVYGVLTILFVVNLAQSPWTSNFYSPEFGLIGHTTVALFFFLLILVLVYHPAGNLARLFRVRLFCYMGAISYCVYLIHTPIDEACFMLFRHFAGEPSTLAAVGITGLAVVITMTLATASWNYFEKPMMEFGRRISPSAAPQASGDITPSSPEAGQKLVRA